MVTRRVSSRRRSACCPSFSSTRVPDILWLCLLGLVYLAWIEVRREPDLLPQAKLWWCLLVFLTNVPGYVAPQDLDAALGAAGAPTGARA